MSGNILNQEYRSVHQKIIRSHRKYYFFLILKYALQFLTISLIGLIAFLLLNLLFDVATSVRGTFFALFVIWFVIFSIFKIYPSLSQIIKPTQQGLFETSRRLGQRDPGVQDAILNYLQIYHEKGSIGSHVLKNMALEQLYKHFAHKILDESDQYKNLLPVGRFIFLPVLILIFMFISLPNQSGIALKKILIPWKNFEEPFPVTLHNTSGNLKVLKNDPVNLSAFSKGVLPDRIYLVIEKEFKSEKTNEEQSSGKIELTLNPTGLYKYTVSHVNTNFSYYFTAKLDRSRYRNKQAESQRAWVEMQERPVIRELRAKIIPPSYTGLKPAMLAPNEGEIFALLGSKVQINIETDRQLLHARMIFADSTELPMQVAGHTAKVNFRLKESNQYAIHIFDTDSVYNDDPIQYGIYLLQDEYPYAEIKQPGADVDLQDNLSLPMITEIKDDFGFTSLWLKGTVYRQGSSKDSTDFQIKIPYKILEKGRAMSEFMWYLTPFYLIPDDYIQYYVEVNDNDKISGPKSFRTAYYVVRLPSLLDILTENREKQEEQIENVEDLVQSSHEIREKLEEVSRELRKKDQISWEQQKEIKEQLSRHKDISDKLSEIQENLENVVNEMDDQQVLSTETLQKYMELQKMVQELITPEFMAAMEKLQNAMEQADINQIQKALENLQFSAEQFEKSIERFYELFKRAKLEQQMDELVKLAEMLTQEQSQINEKLHSEDPTDIPFDRLSKMEKNINENTEFLSEQMDVTQEQYQELMKELSQSLQEAQSYLGEQEVNKSIQEMQQQLSSQQQESAKQSGVELERNFKMLQSMLQMAKQQLIEQQMDQVTDAVQKAMQDVLNASFEQESLAGRSQNLSSASPQINDIARQQSNLMTNTAQIINQLIEIGNQTFFLSPQLNQQMAQAYSSMGQSIQQLENRNPRQAAAHQNQAMSNFNSVLLSLQSSMNQMSEAGSSSGLQNFMEQLQKMSGQQGQLNQESMSLFQTTGPGKMQLSPDAMARLAAQQQMIRNSLEQLSEGAGTRRDVLGRLGDLGSEMDEVIKELKARKMDRKVIERQERILSRLLDAQKSIREKEYSRKREAERETVGIVKSPPELRWELLQQEDRLRRELMNALDEGYSQEYKEYIKKYFEILSRRKIQNP
jgi:hypothetical protein